MSASVADVNVNLSSTYLSIADTYLMGLDYPLNRWGMQQPRPSKGGGNKWPSSSFELPLDPPRSLPFMARFPHSLPSSLLYTCTIARHGHHLEQAPLLLLLSLSFL